MPLVGHAANMRFSEVHRMFGAMIGDWRLVSVVFIIVCTLLTNAAKDGGDIPQVSVIPGPDNFVEDRTTKFSCQPGKSMAGKQISWCIQDAKSGIKTFFTNRKIDTSALMTLDADGRYNYSMLMRRDFSNMQLVCNVSNGPEGFFLLPEIKKTVPIEEVTFGPTNFLLGDPFRVYCDVKAKRSPKKVQVRNLLEFFSPTSNKSNSADLTRYIFDFKLKVKMNPFNNLAMQCIAHITDDTNSKTGNVMSRIAAVTVHFFNFTPSFPSSKLTTTLGQPVTLTYNISANPIPQSANFSVVQCRKMRCEALNDLKPNVSVFGENRFEVAVKFRPQTSASYRLDFRSHLLSEKSPSTEVDVIFFRFLNTNFKLVGKKVRIICLIAANPAPAVDEFRVYLVNQSRAVRTENGLLSFLSNGKFRLEVDTPFNGTASYVVTFKSAVLTNSSRSFLVKSPPDKAAIIVGVVVVFGCVLVIIIVIIILVVKHRRRKDTPTPNPPDEEMPLAPVPVEPQEEDAGPPVVPEPVTTNISKTLLLKVKMPGKSERRQIKTENKEWAAIFEEIIQNVERPMAYQFLWMQSHNSNCFALAAKCVLRRQPQQNYFNEADGNKLTNNNNSDIIVRHFVSPNHPTRQIFSNTENVEFASIVYVQTKVVLLEMADDGTVKECSGNTNVFDPKWLLLIPGLRAQESVFPELSNNKFCNSADGQGVLTEEEVVRLEGHHEEEWCRFYLLLRGGDPFPQWRLPPDKVLEIYRRTDVRLCIKKERLTDLSEGRVLQTNCWVTTQGCQILNDSIMSLMRQEVRFFPIRQECEETEGKSRCCL